ncbi:MAG: Sensor protein, partial [uncultured bacterium]
MLQSIIFAILLVVLLMLSIRLWQCYTVKNTLLIASEERFSIIFENSLPLLIINKSGDILLINQHAKNLFGYDQSQLIGMNVEMLMPVRFRQHHTVLRNDYMKHPVKRPMGKKRDLYILTSTGKEVPVEISLTPIAVKNDSCVSDLSLFASCAFDACIIDSCVLCTIY